MADLLTRLRGNGGAVDIPEIMHEAAAEVELLRVDVEKLRADLNAALKAVLYHFGPEGAQKVTASALAERGEHSNG